MMIVERSSVHDDDDRLLGDSEGVGGTVFSKPAVSSGDGRCALQLRSFRVFAFVPPKMGARSNFVVAPWQRPPPFC